MDSATALSVGFLTSHPKGAITVLEALAPGDAAAFLKGVPDDVAGRALELMQPLVTAAILRSLPRSKAAAVLLTMDAHDRSRVLRSLDDDLRTSILDEMPTGTARDLARFLNYPEGSAGAWMSSNVAVFEQSALVRDCLVQLRAMPDRVRSSVFVVDGQKKLRGAVELAGLLAAPDDSAIDALADRGVKRLSPFARLTSIVALTAWDTALSLPVVDTKGRLLGALHFDRLREGLAREQRAETGRHVSRIVVHVAEALLVCAAGILHGGAAKPALSRSAGEKEA